MRRKDVKTLFQCWIQIIFYDKKDLWYTKDIAHTVTKRGFSIIQNLLNESFGLHWKISSIFMVVTLLKKNILLELKSPQKRY